MAKLYFRYGAMNCGKSTALIQVAHNYEERGMRVVIIKPKIDTKGADTVVSRLGTIRKTDILADADINVANTVRKLSKPKKIDCILVDEAQFLTSTQIDQLLELTVKDNIPVIAYGLRADFSTHGFPGSIRLFELAHTIEELKTICRCGRKALFNGRKINGKYVFKGKQVAIDGENKVEYESLCATCYFEKKAKK
jgi:thymidine kinase